MTSDVRREERRNESATRRVPGVNIATSSLEQVLRRVSLEVLTRYRQMTQRRFPSGSETTREELRRGSLHRGRHLMLSVSLPPPTWLSSSKVPLVKVAFTKSRPFSPR